MTKNGDRTPSRGMGFGKVRSGKEEKSVQVNVCQVLDRMIQPFMNYSTEIAILPQRFPQFLAFHSSHFPSPASSPRADPACRHRLAEPDDHEQLEAPSAKTPRGQQAARPADGRAEGALREGGRNERCSAQREEAAQV